MRRNPLLYSDHGEIEEPIEVPEPPKQKRSLFFYFIILVNSLLVVFVLGIIWFLFLKSPDLHIKELTERFFGTTSTQSTSAITAAPPAVKTQNDTSDTETSTTAAPSRQEQEEIQQLRLKQMREQEELAAERERLEKIRAELEAEQTKAKSEQTPTTGTMTSSEVAKPTTLEITDIIIKPSASAVTQAGNTSDTNTVSATSNSNNTQEMSTEQEDVEPAVVPNAASEALVPPGNTVDTQVDQIMELMKQQKQQQETNQPLNDSRAPSDAGQVKKVMSESTPAVSPELIERQLEAIIETEILKNEAGKLLRQANDEDKKLQINQKLSILQANAV